MIVLIPLRRHRVSYTVGQGRPYSPLERLLLQAVQQGHTSLDAIHQLFALHRRVLIEAVVTLMHAGWLAIASESENFVVTAAGQAALAQQDALPKGRTLTVRSMAIFEERTAGQLAAQHEIALVRGRELRGLVEQPPVLRRGELPNTVERGAVDPMLRRDMGQWIHSINDVVLEQASGLFAMADVDLARRTVSGIPRRWIDTLALDCIDAAERQPQTQSDKISRSILKLNSRIAEGVSTQSSSDWTESIDRADVLTTVEAHRQLLRDTLRSTDVRWAAVLSPRLSLPQIEAVAPDIEAAIARGMTVIVGYSFQSTTDKEAVARLKKLRFHGEQDNVAGKLLLTKYSGSGAALLVDRHDQFDVFWGSDCWLKTAAGSVRTFSVRLRDPQGLARVLRTLSDSFETDSDGRAVAVKLDGYAGELAARRGAATGKFSVQILRGPEHLGVLRMLTHKTDNLANFTLGALGWQSEATKTLSLVQRFADSVKGPVSVYCSALETSADAQRTTAEAELQKLGVRVVVDTSTDWNGWIAGPSYSVLGTFPWLDAHSAGNSTALGLLFSGEGVAELFGGTADSGGNSPTI